MLLKRSILSVFLRIKDTLVF